MQGLLEALQALSDEELREVDAWLHQELASREAEERLLPTPEGATLVDERRHGAGTYRLLKVRCGKPNCKCARGALHGPYWYLAWWEGGRTRWKYIGKELK